MLIGKVPARQNDNQLSAQHDMNRKLWSTLLKIKSNSSGDSWSCLNLKLVAFVRYCTKMKTKDKLNRWSHRDSMGYPCGHAPNFPPKISTEKRFVGWSIKIPTEEKKSGRIFIGEFFMLNFLLTIAEPIKRYRTFMLHWRNVYLFLIVSRFYFITRKRVRKLGPSKLLLRRLT